MKTTIEIADELFQRVQEQARKEKTSFRDLTEEGLRLVVARKQRKKKRPAFVTFGGGGLTPEFKNASWEKVRDEIYGDRK